MIKKIVRLKYYGCSKNVLKRHSLAWIYDYIENTFLVLGNKTKNTI